MKCLISAMKTEMDILKSAPELKTMPYSIPEGYFGRVKAEIKSAAVESNEGPRPFITRLAPYAAMAAVFVFLVTAGTFFLERTTQPEQSQMEEYYFYSNMIPVTDPYAFETVQVEYESAVEDEDIIEYLIYSGITAELIELSK